MSSLTRTKYLALCFAFFLLGCPQKPIIPTPGTDNTWQLITTYTRPSGPWIPLDSSIWVRLPDASASHPATTAGVDSVPVRQPIANVNDPMLACSPAPACAMVDFSRVYIGTGNTVFWFARNHGPAVTYRLDVSTNKQITFTDTTIARYWRAGEDFEVDVNWAANSYRIEGVLHGVRVGFAVADTRHLSDSARKLVRLVKITNLPDSGTVAQRNYLFQVVK